MTYQVVRADFFKEGDKVTLGSGEAGVVKQFVTSPTGFHSYRVEVTDGPRKGSVVGATAPAMTRRGRVRTAATIVPVQVGDKTFSCRVAVTPSEHRRGLQGAAPLDPDEGMLFVFGHPRAATFHMGAVDFPIDIMFVEKGRVARVVRGANPGSRERWSYPLTDSVVEVAAGCAPAVGSSVALSSHRRTAREGTAWIDPAGQWHEFSRGTHEEWASKYLNVAEFVKAFNKLIEDGWIRVSPAGVTVRELTPQVRRLVERHYPSGAYVDVFDGARMLGVYEYTPVGLPSARWQKRSHKAQELWRRAIAPPLGEEPQRYKIEFPKNVKDPVPNPTERWKDRSTPDVSDPNANQMENSLWKEQLGYDTVDFHDDPNAPAFRPSAALRVGDRYAWRTLGGAQYRGFITELDANVVHVQCDDGVERATDMLSHERAAQVVIDDPAELIVGLIQAMAEKRRPLDWHRDALNSNLAYAVVTEADIADWINEFGMTGGEATDVLDAATSPEGMQVLGDGFVLSGLAQIANVAATDEAGRVLVLWTEYENVA